MKKKNIFKVFDTFDMLEKRYSDLITEADDENTDEETENEGDDNTDDEGNGGDMPEEAIDDESEVEADSTPENEAPANYSEGDPNTDPNMQADAQAGTFVSDNKKAEFAKTLLDALNMQPPAQGEIPQQYLNVTTDNADEVITFIKSLLSLSAPLTDDDESEINQTLKGN